MANNRKLFSLKLSTASLVLIPVGVGINYVGATFAQLLKLPLWLDSIGTILTGVLAGPIVGALVGALNNIIYGLTQNPIMFVYALTQIGIGLLAGILAHLGAFKKLPDAIISGFALGGIAIIVSTPLNILFWGGQTGNAWGDGVFAALISANRPVWFASLLDEIVVDFPDKVVVAVIAFLIFKALPETLKAMYEDEEIETF
ncbi:ECF transporter S component [Lactococcus insecticola]|uniref:Membrane protein n=1 Tax=Pseudolactococcus insecticola TaxID=2709158 RepID=A0A6A0B7N0_9LACT|nr:ECF transporter S component [Lactococcus insecticola]GFH40478.1 membrane protein [Lactococcus insecticola]